MELIAVGKITKPIGTKGDVRVLPFTNNRKRFAILKWVLVGLNESKVNRYSIVKTRTTNEQVNIHLSTIETLDAAEKLRNQYLFVPKEQRVKLHKGSYFIDDIIGCEIFTEAQKVIGIVRDVLSLPANDVWVVWNGEKEILIPAVKAIIRHVDVERKRVIVYALEGLLE